MRREAGGLGLPKLIDHRQFDTLDDWLDYLHAQYRAIAGEAGIVLWGRPVVADGKLAADGRSERFWHIITDSTGGRGSRRVLNPGRGAVMGRVWHVLELLAAGDPRVCWWREGSPEGRSVHVAPLDFSFEVVLLERRGSYVLKTAYPSNLRRMNRAAASKLSRRPGRVRLYHPGGNYLLPAAGLRPRLLGARANAEW